MIYKKYFVREDFEPPDGMLHSLVCDSIDATIQSKPYQYDDIEHFFGNLACGPYIIVTCDSQITAEVFQHTILDVFYKLKIKRR